MEEIMIETLYIQLDQFLKWIGLLESGGQVKLLLEDEAIWINGQLATERRKKLYPGDIVKVEGAGEWKVIGS